MTKTEFIEKAILGGWRKEDKLTKIYSCDKFPADDIVIFEQDYLTFYGDVVLKKMNLYEILLDPKAWQAVGKVEGWDECDCGRGKNCAHFLLKQWQEKMKGMIDALCEGKSINQFLETL